MSMQIHVNGEAQVLSAGTTVAALLAGQGLTGKRIAVERNGEIVPRSQHDRCVLVAGDRLEIVHAIGGG
jgi:sulfur carrier protein